MCIGNAAQGEVAKSLNGYPGSNADNGKEDKREEVEDNYSPQEEGGIYESHGISPAIDRRNTSHLSSSALSWTLSCGHRGGECGGSRFNIGDSRVLDKTR